MRCPVCRAENTESTCRRCKADLSLLAQLDETRASELTQAAQAAAMGDGELSLRHAEEAHRLRADHDSWRRLAVAHLLRRDFARAINCYRQTSK